MEIRSVDPTALKADPANPRHLPGDPYSETKIAASVQAVGIIHPPVVVERDGELVIHVGHRRVRAAIAVGLSTIDVIVRSADDVHMMQQLSENVVREAMNPVDTWRAIDRLQQECGWSEDAIAAGLALTVRSVRRLSLLGQLYPPMLEQIGKGNMPREGELRVIAAASLKEQATVWKAHKPKKGEDVAWWQIERALHKKTFSAANARFDDELAAAFGVRWTVDLFAPADEDGRVTTDTDAFLQAQEAWLQDNMPANGVMLTRDQYGQYELPKGAERVWDKPDKSAKIGFHIDRDGEIIEVPFVSKATKPKAEKGSQGPGDDAPATRAPITRKGWDLIGDMRYEALTKTLLEGEIDDTRLMAMLVVAFAGNNVTVHSGDPNNRYGRASRIIDPLLADQILTTDIETIRKGARAMLAHVLSTKTGYSSSGMVARYAGEAINADVNLPSMAHEDMLKCLSKSALEELARQNGIAPGARAKDTRAALLDAFKEQSLVIPAASFALSDEERDKVRSEKARFLNLKGDEGEEAEDVDGNENIDADEGYELGDSDHGYAEADAA